MSPTIQEQSDQIAAASRQRLPAEVLETFARDQAGWQAKGRPVDAVGVGDVLSDFTLPDATGRNVSLSELVADGPAVLVFYRGGWCPYCNLALHQYQSELVPHLPDYTATLAAISPKAGTYYWKVTYGGSATNDGSVSACGSEILTVAANATTLGLPSSKLCLSKRKFLVHPRAPKGVKLVSIEVQINGKTVTRGKLSKNGTTVNLVGLPKGAFKVALITKSSKGKTYEEVRTFHTCVAGKHRK